MLTAGELLAGVARVDITPPVGIELFGYHRSSPMTDIHDPLWLTALALVAEHTPSYRVASSMHGAAVSVRL